MQLRPAYPNLSENLYLPEPSNAFIEVNNSHEDLFKEDYSIEDKLYPHEIFTPNEDVPEERNDQSNEMYEPEGAMMMVSLDNVDQDKVVSGDIIYYDGGTDDLEEETVAEALTRKIGHAAEEDSAENVIFDDFEETVEDMVVDESQNSFIVYPSNYIAGFDKGANGHILSNIDSIDPHEDFVMSEIDDFVTSPIDLNTVEVITPLSEELVTDQKMEEVMNSNTKIVSMLENTLEMQAYLFNKFFSYIG